MIVGNFLTLEKEELSRKEWTSLFKRMQFVDAKQNLYMPYRILRSGKVILPRGAWNLLPDHVTYTDRRSLPEDKTYDFKITLDDVKKDKRFERQSECVKAMFENEQGIILRPPGTGKSNILLAFIASVPTRCLVLVHTEDILNQWQEYAAAAVPDMPVGIIRADEMNVQKLTIATVQTYHKLITRNRKEWKNEFGCIISDESHHAPAATFEVCINLSAAKYRFGATASATRADGKHPYMKLILGPVIHRMAFESPIPVHVVPIKTDFRYGYRGHWDWSRMIDQLTNDEERNEQIAEVVDAEIEQGNTILVLSRRIEHLENIFALLRNQDQAEILAAKLKSKKEREEILAGFRKGDPKCVLGTQLADEALNVRRLSRIVLAHPGKHQGRIIQQVGRALRTFPGKTEAVIYDVADTKTPILRRQWTQRKGAYHSMKIKVKGGVPWR